MSKKIITLLIAIFISVFTTFSQTIEYPVWTVKSHSNMDIEKIVLSNNETAIYLIVMSDLDIGAWFCADKNIYIYSTLTKQKLNLSRKENIPECPQRHIFTKKGEVLRFTLFFPPLQPGTQNIDLVEDCDDACFYFKNIVLDQQLNNEIRLFERSVEEYSKGEKDKATVGFENIVNNCNDKTSYRYSHSLSILPVLYEETNQFSKAEKAYEAILNSDLDDKTQTGSENEHFSNFKHKAALRMAIVQIRNKNYDKAIEMLNTAQSIYPIQSLDEEYDLRKNDYFLMLEKRLEILSAVKKINEFINLSISESFNQSFGDLPAEINILILKTLNESTDYRNFISSFEKSLETIVISNYPEGSEITLMMNDDKYRIKSSRTFSVEEVKTQLNKMKFISILRTEK